MPESLAGCWIRDRKACIAERYAAIPESRASTAVPTQSVPRPTCDSPRLCPRSAAAGRLVIAVGHVASISTPEQPEAFSVPSNERVRLHDGEDSTPVDQLRQRDQRNSGRIIGPPRLDLPLDVQRQLLAQKQILGGELYMWPPRRRHESQDVASDAHHRAHIEARTGLGHAA
jgi:hypothetical protein